MVSEERLSYAARRSLENMENLTMEGLRKEAEEIAPLCIEILESINGSSRKSRETKDSIEKRHKGATLTLIVLIYQKSQRANAYQAVVSLILLGEKATKDLFTIFNGLGVCLSYSATMKLVEDLIVDLHKRRLDSVEKFPNEYRVIIDNLDMMKNVAQQTIGKHSELIHWTLMFIVENQIKFPDSDFQLSEISKPQIPRNILDTDMM